jgi:predicted DNA-binding transcriptional regulator AlpA
MNQVNISKFGQLPDDALASVKSIAALSENGISTIWRYAATDPDFPKSIRLSARCTRFRVGDVRAWLAKKSGVS